MKKPITYGDPVASKGDFDVFVAALSEDDLPSYAVINRVHGVVEHTTENLAYAKDWLDHFGKSAVEQMNEAVAGSVLNFKKN